MRNPGSSMVAVLLLSGLTLGYSSQALAKVTRTCPVVGEVAGDKSRLYVQGVPGSATTVLLARIDSRKKTEKVLGSSDGVSNYFAPLVQKGKSVTIEAYTYNNNGSGCEAVYKFTRTVVGTKR